MIIFVIMHGIFCSRTPCSTPTYPQGSAYPHLRIIDLEQRFSKCEARQRASGEAQRETKNNEKKMSKVTLAHCWLSVETEFPHLAKKAVKVLIAFTSTYLCEWGFSALTLIKSKCQSRLQPEYDLRLFLCASKTQTHCSH